MKKLLLTILLVLLIPLHYSCQKNVLLGDGTELGPRVLPMQIEENESIIASETGYLLVLASTTDAPFIKFSAEHLSDFEGYINETIIALPKDVTIDSEGNFSQPVSTVMIKYPVKGTTKAGDILAVRFTFTDQNGKSASGIASKKVVNFKTNSTKVYLYSSLPWYNFLTGKSITKTGIGNDLYKNDLEVFWYMKDGVQYLCSPNSDMTATQFTNLSYYKREETHNTRFIELKGVTFAQVNDETFSNMDFSNAVDVIVLKHLALYGVLLQDGRKAVLNTEIYNTVYSRVNSKYELSAQ